MTFHGLLSGVDCLPLGLNCAPWFCCNVVCQVVTNATRGVRHSAPARAVLSCCRLLTADWSDRTVIHVELDLADSGMRFAAGDAVGVLPCNDPALVAGLLARLGVDGDAVFDVQAAGEQEWWRRHLMPLGTYSLAGRDIQAVCKHLSLGHAGMGLSQHLRTCLADHGGSERLWV